MSHINFTRVNEQNPPLIQKNESSNIYANLKTVYLYGLYLINTIVQKSFGSLFEKRAFSGKLIFKTGNFGKKEDIVRYTEKSDVANFYELATRKGFKIKKTLSLKPFGFSGACTATSFYFCKQWLSIGDISYLATEFKNGSPYEAISLQGCYNILPNKFTNLYHLPLYEHLNEMFATLFDGKERSSEEIQEIFQHLRQKAKENEHISQTEQCGWILEATERFFIEKKEIQEYCTFVQSILKNTYDYSLEVGLFYNAAYQISLKYGKTNDREEMKRNMILNQLKTVGSFINLDVTYKMFGTSPMNILTSKLSTWDVGAYCFSTPVYSVFGNHSGMHAFSLIKASDSLYYLFDPNFGAKKITTNPEQALTQLYKFYCGNFLTKEPRTFLDKVTRIFLRIKNILFLESSAPLFSAIHDRFEVFQLRSLE